MAQSSYSEKASAGWQTALPVKPADPDQPDGSRRPADQEAPPCRIRPLREAIAQNLQNIVSSLSVKLLINLL